MILVSIFASVLMGFHFSAAAERLQARLFDESDGLSNLSVVSFEQQADGRLWIGTANGVFRYDGSVFTQFGRSDGLTDPGVFSLLIDHTGTLWAGTHGGLFRFDDGRFHEIRLGEKSLRIGINSMLASTTQGELIAETSNGMVSVERDGSSGVWTALRYGQRHPSFPDSKDTDGIAVDGANRLWFGCDGKLCSYDGKTAHTFGPAEGVPQDFYVSIFVAHDGRVWARGRKHILSWRPGDTAIQDRTGSLAQGEVTTVYRRFTEDAQGRILTPTAKGFASWDGKAWHETLATSKGSIDGATVVFAGRENTVWIGTDGSGLLQSLGYGFWHNYGKEEGLKSPAMQAIAADRAGRIWLGQSLGAQILLPSSGQIVSSPLAGEKDSAFVQSFAPAPDGGMWEATTLGHIFHVTAAGRVDEHYSIDTYIKRILLDAQGTLWIAASNGLYTLDCRQKPCQPQPFESRQLAKIESEDISIAPDNSLWVASRHGLDHIQGRGVSHVALPGLPAELKLICLDADGTLWITGQSPGLFHIRVDGEVAHLIESYSRPRLASDMIEFIEHDNQGRLWIGTDHGINALSSGKVFHLTDDDGLIWNDSGSRSFLSQADGSVWIGTSKGVSHLLDPAAAFKRAAFSVIIDDAQYRGKAFQDGASLRWNAATPALRFSGLTFRNNRNLIYHYQLAGFDTAETISKTASISYPKLPPGNYVFRVYAEDAGLGVVSAPADLHFTLTPPWWRTSWFNALCAVLLFGLLAAIWYLLHLALLAQRRKLQLMVRERTIELENMAMRDALTGLLNRRALFAALATEVERATSKGTDLCVAIVDLDHFKRVNDTFGHLAGDEVLRETAKRLTSVARSADGRSSDIVGRYGGEEFLIIFKSAQYSLGFERCESIRRAMCERPIRYLDHDLTVTCSIGLAWTHNNLEPVTKLLADADQALYVAKSKGRNFVECAFPDTRLLSQL